MGNGWVSASSSPGTFDASTGRSSMGHTGSPVTRSKTYSHVCLLGWATALISRPSTVMSTRIGAHGRSQSHTSWWMNWKCQRRSPVSRSTATRLSENRLSPCRCPP